jgi:hypothetical protein
LYSVSFKSRWSSSRNLRSYSKPSLPKRMLNYASSPRSIRNLSRSSVLSMMVLGFLSTNVTNKS